MSGTDIINLGIMAHVDAGKTTLTEQILLATGAIRKAGSVDGGDAHTDTLEVERRRGISVKSASVQTVWKDTQLHIIDTPGHMDFSSEIERALVVLESAVLVVSAVEGVQSQTEAVYKALSSLRIPVIFFINKTDRAGADAEGAAADIQERLGARLFDAADAERALELLCDDDDALLEKYLEQGPETFAEEERKRLLRDGFRACRVSPYVAGQAINGAGVEALLNLITEICPRFQDKSNGKLSGIIYKIEHDKTAGRLAHVKLNGGELKNRDTVRNKLLSLDEKITQIRRIQGTRLVDAGVLRAGEIGVVSGLSKARIYDAIGGDGQASRVYRVSAPLLKARIISRDEADYPALVAALTELSAEDPMLDMTWVAETRELIVSITGLIQMEILQDVLAERFGLHADFTPPTVIYKETATIVAEGYDAYTMPKPCWAVLKFLIEPAERGSGVSYGSIVNVDKIAKAYQAQVEQAMPDALKQGPLGWEVTDVKITLIDGGDHVFHTHPLDFIVATPMAVMKGLVNAKTALLEPYYRFRLSVPEELSGKLMNEITLMRGSYTDVATVKDRTYIEGSYPVAEGVDFSVRLQSLTGGRGQLSLEFGGYGMCPEGRGQTAPYRGINPLDRAKYILSIRHAL